MYRLKLNKEQYEHFKKRVRCEMIIHDLSIKDIAERTNYSEQSIRGFLCKRNSKFLAYAIAEALNMEITDYET